MMKKTLKTITFIVFFSQLLLAQNVKQGCFKIQSKIQGKYMDVKGAKSDNGTPIHLWSKNNSIAQKFTLENAGNGYFYIKSHVGKYIHIKDRSNKPGVIAHIWSGKGNDNTKWKFESLGNGYYLIKSKKGTYLDVKGGKSNNGTPIWLYTKNSSNAQQWKLVPIPISGKKRMTSFDPQKHGFKFDNDFKVSIGDPGSIKLDWGGLCGGMAFSAADFYYSNIKIPQQNYTPPVGSKLYQYLYDRQQNAIWGASIDKSFENYVNPFGWRNEEFWGWAVYGKLKQLIASIDKNKPVPILLFNGKSRDFAKNHWVIAIGYDLGGYQFNKKNDPAVENVKIFVYDPNHPLKKCVLIPRKGGDWFLDYHIWNDKNNCIGTNLDTDKKRWRHYYVYEQFKHKKPPVFMNKKTGTDYIDKLVIKFKTGGDDLRGGGDNVDVIVEYNNGKSEHFKNVNRDHRWPDNSTSNIDLIPKNLVKYNQIKSIKISTTFRGGFSGDNWNLNSVCMDSYSGRGIVKHLIQNYERKRFTGEDRNLILFSKYYKSPRSTGSNKTISIDIKKFDSPIHNNDCRRIQGDLKIRCFNSKTHKEYSAIKNNSKLVHFPGNKTKDFKFVKFDKDIPSKTVSFNMDIKTFNAKNYYFIIEPTLKRCHKSCDTCSGYHCKIKYSKKKLSSKSFISGFYKGALISSDKKHDISLELIMR